MTKQSRKSRRNKRGGNYPEAPVAQQTDYSQQIAAPLPQPEQAAIPQPAPAAQEAPSSGFFSNLFGTSKPATGAPDAEKPWYQVWGGRRRTRSRKGRKARKGRKSRCYKK